MRSFLLIIYWGIGNFRFIVFGSIFAILFIIRLLRNFTQISHIVILLLKFLLNFGKYQLILSIFGIVI